MNVEKMRELLTWMRSNPVNMLISAVDGNAVGREVLLETALRIGDALEAWLLVEELREPEGASITISCDNPDFNGQPNAVVDITDDWTGWKERRFGGENVLEALRAAKTVRDIATRETDAHGREKKSLSAAATNCGQRDFRGCAYPACGCVVFE